MAQTAQNGLVSGALSAFTTRVLATTAASALCAFVAFAPMTAQADASSATVQKDTSSLKQKAGIGSSDAQVREAAEIYGTGSGAPYGVDTESAVKSGLYDLPAARRAMSGRTTSPGPAGVNASDSNGYGSAYGITQNAPRTDWPVSLPGGIASPSTQSIPTSRPLSNLPYSGPSGFGHRSSMSGTSAFRGDRSGSGNVVQQFVSATMDALGSSRKRFKTPSLESSFGDLEDYQDVYARAAGWNGDRYFQYQLGLMFETGEGVMTENEAAAYLWYTLSAAQNLEIAQQRRERMLTRSLRGNDGEATKLEVYFKFIEIYVFGGPESAYRLGQVLESNFFQGRHNQDGIDADNGAPRRRLIHAYAAYTLALEGGHPDAERARLVLTQRENLTQYESIAGEEQAEMWSSWIGMSEGESPFLFTSKQTKQALSRGSDFQYRRGDYKDLKDKARSLLSSGRAYKALGDVRNAKIAFEAAIALDPASTAAQEASEELVALTTTCSAARPQAPGDPLGKIWKISVAEQQRALRALGYYDGPIDNVPGPGTRASIRRFLMSLNVDVREVLNSEQVVELVCTAAQVRGSASSQNILGVMYAEGIGVVQNVQLAHHWFGKAALQGDASAKFNLGRMYAREIGVPISGHPQNCAIARSYLREAADAYHPGAGEELRKLRTQPACRVVSSRSKAVRGG